MPKVRSFTVLPALPDSLKDLEVIAKNMFWSWNLEFVRLFKRIDSNLWKACAHNPIKLLGTVSQQRLEDLAKNDGFICELKRAVEKLNNYQNRQSWFDKVKPQGPPPVIAYFSAEFGIHECLPVYSGGLGVLAGDHLKSASDLGVPLVAVGLLYQKGYFRQYLNIDGWQQEVYAENDFYNMPLELVRQKGQKPVTIQVEYPNGPVYAQIWSVNVGRVKLYLLDANIAANTPEDRLITANLYGGDLEMRIRQEIMLGIGGLRSLFAMGIRPTVCHMNEGHAAFMALERIRNLQQDENLSFDEAFEATKAGNVFTIHTPVKAGNDEFPAKMMNKYFGNYFPQLQIDEKQFLGLGRINIDDENENFKMPVLALKLSSYKNGVSKLHGDVTRNMWANLWQNLPIHEVPVGSITNGIHIKTWLSEEMNSLYERYLGPNWSEETIDKAVWENIKNIPDEEFWRTHQRGKERLIAFSRKRLKAQMQRRGTYHTELNWAEEVLDPEALTIGFARRFATYKRGNLLLKDPTRLAKILNDPDRPVQIIFAGKAHPRDTEGKEIIRQIIHFANHYDMRRRIVFLEDYNIDVARMLVRGVDVWLNNPRRPFEASGTSGMKAAINGALNMSTLDGWWCEGYRPEGGWAIGSGEDYEDAAYQDMVESQAMYNMLENEVVPLFYTRSADKLPRAWIHRAKNSIQFIAPQFNTDRMVGEYTQNFYIPAAKRWQHLTAENMARIKALAKWKQNISSVWNELEIKDVQINIKIDGKEQKLSSRAPKLKVGQSLQVKALVKLSRLTPEDVSVQLYSGHVNTWGEISDGTAVEMKYQSQNEQTDEHFFVGTMPCETSGRQGIAVRLLPKHPDLLDPNDMGLIQWENTSAKRDMVTNPVG
ncbi:MAG: glycosyltransferase family 1 protein [Planctomycetes bacterium]|nr:glycosyltransferase family 1 protein [Planctomycetota bacterium]